MARANMKGVPKDELVLAEALANAEANGLTFGVGSFGLNERGCPVNDDKSVCVIGAYTVGLRSRNRFSRFERLTGLDDYSTYLGNDRSPQDKWWEDFGDADGETLGYAFRVAMTEI